MRTLTIIITIFLMSLPAYAAQQQAKQSCAPDDMDCLLNDLQTVTGQIGDVRWRDQTYREIAKLLAHEKKNDEAIALIDKIVSPDVKSMTIRGIGMAAADTDLTREQFDDLWTKLLAEAHKIDSPASYAVAINYISDAQAQSGDNEAAMKTALALDNQEMRNKALYDCAKIQADRAQLDASMASIGAIDDPGFRDKGYRDISKIYADNKTFDMAVKAADAIENSYQKAQSVLYILAKQITPEEVSLIK